MQAVIVKLFKFGAKKDSSIALYLHPTCALLSNWVDMYWEVKTNPNLAYQDSNFPIDVWY